MERFPGNVGRFRSREAKMAQKRTFSHEQFFTRTVEDVALAVNKFTACVEDINAWLTECLQTSAESSENTAAVAEIESAAGQNRLP